MLARLGYKFILTDEYVLILYFQIGGELMDFIIVLHDMKAVKTFCSRMHFSLGAGCSAAAGPVGRVLEADLRAGDRGSGMCYTYSCSKGSYNEFFCISLNLLFTLKMPRTFCILVHLNAWANLGHYFLVFKLWLSI